MKIVKILSLFFAIVIVATVIFILFNGFQASNDSNFRSNKITDVVKSIIDPDGKMEYESVSKVVRKVAHILEYMFLGLASGMFIVLLKLSGGTLHIAAAFSFVLVVSILDEFIQGFRGRTSTVSDQLFDTVGGLVGIGISLLIFIIIKNGKNFRKEKSSVNCKTRCN